MRGIVACSSNKKRKIGSDEQELQDSHPTLIRRWDTLEIDILQKIFDCLSLRHLSRDVSLVCHSWELSCRDFLFRSRDKLELTSSMLGLNSRTKTFKFHVRLRSYEKLYRYTPIDIKLMKRFKSIMEGNDAYGVSLESWRQSLRTVYVSLSHNILDDHLVYIAERTPGLQMLELSGSLRLTGRGFAKALSFWKNLNYLCLAKVFLTCFVEITKEIGKNSPGLSTLHLNLHVLSVRSAYAIIKHLPRLRILKFDRSDL